LKIRIFTLAKELQLDSKILIGYCQKVGIHLKDSPLASISEEERDRVLEYMRQQGAGAAPSSQGEVVAPVRETVRVTGSKVPTLRPTTTPRPVQDEAEPEPEPTDPTGPLAEIVPSPVAATSGPTPVIREQAPTNKAPVVPPASATASAATPTVSEPEGGETGSRGVTPSVTTPRGPASAASTSAGAAKGGPAALPPVERPTRPFVSGRPPALKLPSRQRPTAVPPTPEAAIPSEPSATAPQPVEVAAETPPREPPPVRAEASSTEAVPETRPEAETPPPSAGEVPPGTPVRPAMAPMRREDYVTAPGSSRREMVAIGSVSRLAPDSKKQKPRPMPTLPKLAEPPPSSKPTTAATPVSTGPAQKPEMRISRDMLEKTPLQEHIKAHNQEKKRRPGEEPGEDFSEEAKRTPGRGPVRPMISAGGLVSDRKGGRPVRRGRSREEDEDQASLRLRRSRGGRRGSQTQLKNSAEIEFPITVRGLSEAMGRRANELIGLLMKKGQMLTINSYLEEDQALELALECGVDLQIAREKDLEEQLEESVREDENPEQRRPRPPIVTILGHVDHGKTTLLDKIRSANVAAGEFGGITQHIAAYQVPVGDKRVTFLDTPGHAAFAEMRARGANVTDIAVLVVAANDGVMPQTVEALNHARAANVPIVVAMNKVDLPDRNEQRVLQELATHNLLAAEWGGDTEVVRTSGATGQGVEDLLETLLTVAELGELTGNPDKGGHGVCLEAFRDEGRGVLVWMIVQDGSLRKGDVVLCGSAHGRIRAMYDDHDREVEVAGPSMPVKVAGLDRVPDAGDKFYTVSDIDEAREIAELRQQRGREAQLAQRGRVRTLQEILSQAETGEVQELPVIIKADTPGSLEAIKSEILKFQHAEVRVQILHDGVGGVNESDIYLASASGAIVLAFHVVAEDRAEQLAEREGVEIRQYQIIYEVTDDIRKALEGLLKPQVVQSRTGRAIVLQTFDISRFGRVAGCRVLNGLIERSNLVRVVRDQRILNEYKIASLKRGKDDAREVREGLECGIRLDGFDDVKEGDILEAIKIEEVKRTL